VDIQCRLRRRPALHPHRLRPRSRRCDVVVHAPAADRRGRVGRLGRAHQHPSHHQRQQQRLQHAVLADGRSEPEPGGLDQRRHPAGRAEPDAVASAGPERAGAGRPAGRGPGRSGAAPEAAAVCLHLGADGLRGHHRRLHRLRRSGDSPHAASTRCPRSSPADSGRRAVGRQFPDAGRQSGAQTR
jgi:hypothetical protein